MYEGAIPNKSGWMDGSNTVARQPRVLVSKSNWTLHFYYCYDEGGMRMCIFHARTK